MTKLGHGVLVISVLYTLLIAVIWKKLNLEKITKSSEDASVLHWNVFVQQPQKYLKTDFISLHRERLTIPLRIDIITEI